MMRRALIRLAVCYVLLSAALFAILAAVGALDGGRAALSAAALGLGAAIGACLAIATFRSLDQIAEAARGIASGDLDRRITTGGASGVAELASAFNAMTGTLQSLVAAASLERNRLAATLNSTVNAVVAVDAKGTITFANVAAKRLLAGGQQEMVGRPFAWVMPNQQVSDAIRLSREEGREETCLIERPGRQYLQVITTPIVDSGDWATLVMCHDLTDVRRTELMRRDFVANVSHELRTPLASLRAVIETLDGGALEDPAVAREFLSRADGEVQRLAQLVEELLELSRIESGELALDREPVDLAAVVADAVERLRAQARRRQLELSLQVADALPPVIGDARRLERAALNLIQNAIEFTPAGGSVRVSAGAEDGAVTVAVSDTGVGIAPDDLPRVFERFYKVDRARRSVGTGLGLAIVKHTIEAHGGSVSAESAEGRGSTFRFSLPAVTSSPL